MATEVKPLHPSKAELPIFVSVLGSSIDVNPTQFSKADLPIVVRELDNEIVVTPVQLANANSPILVTVFGISTEVKLEQPLNT